MATSLGYRHKNTVAGATLVTKNARLIIQQADIPHIKEIPNLPTHQAAAKAQSNRWIDNIWPQIIKITADIIDFANTYQATYDQLKTLVPKLQAGDKTTKDEFIQAVEVVLIGGLKEKSKSAKSIAATIKQFHHKFQPLYNEFQADFTEANKKMTEDNEEIQDKISELNSLRCKAEGYSSAAIGLGVAVPATISADAFTAETGVGLIIGGILVASEIAAMVTMLVLYAKAMHRINELTNEINELKSEVAQLTLIEHQIRGLFIHTQNVLNNSASVADAWDVLELELIATVNNLKKITPQETGTVINNQLKAANWTWGVVLKQAETMQPNGGRLEEKKVGSAEEMQKALNKQAGI